ncbi:MAG: hypothetical protein DWQ35_21800 [Planctomycetota bacterium]|nr:MAG: hypothetical protein DWQ35_21800 [Planctomycetota bacterium]REK31560.1 MAG: hypothetical protein DWQ42_00270 [Planctomycetota bacterium]REK43102.1 MAG: hypothetical protein DWQ46_12060 [Planctomycetota bacterium]
MHASWAAVFVAATLGIDVGWQPVEDGSLEYIIQIEPEMLERLKEGQELTAGVRPSVLRNMSRYRIVVGRQPLPRETATTAASPPAQPGRNSPIPALPAEDGSTPGGPPTPTSSAAAPPAATGSEPGRGSGMLDDENRPTAPSLLPPAGSPPPSDPLGSDLPGVDGAPPASDLPAAVPPATYPSEADSTPPAPSAPAAEADRETGADDGFPPLPSRPTEESPAPRDGRPSYTPPAGPPISTWPAADPPDTSSAAATGPTGADDAVSLGPRPQSGDRATTPPAPLTVDPNVTPVEGRASEDLVEERATTPATAVPAASSPSGNTPASASTSEAGAERPWWLLIGSWFLLFVSIGANVFLVWIAWEARTRLRSMLDRARLAQSPLAT